MVAAVRAATTIMVPEFGTVAALFWLGLYLRNELHFSEWDELKFRMV